MVATTQQVIRIMGVWVRRADAGLATTAARNAADDFAVREAEALEARRTLHDLERLVDQRLTISA